MRTFIIVAIVASAVLVLAAAFVPSTGLPLTLAGTGLAFVALIVAVMRRR